MATQSMLRNGLVSPTRTSFQRIGSTRSILKRPSPASPAPPKPCRSVHFGYEPSSPKMSVTRPSRTFTYMSITSFPRSPYPSASLVTPSQYSDIDVDGPTHRGRASSLDLPKRNKKGLTLGSSFVTPPAPKSSSLGRDIFSPSIDKNEEPAPLDLESRLSQAFWEALSLEEAENSADEVMVTALEYPPSAVEPSQIMYADAEGVLWSPALPMPSAAVDKIRDSLMSPGKRSSIDTIVRRDFTAPSPNDPFAAFPSFASAMEMDGAITYPSRVALECEA